MVIQLKINKPVCRRVTVDFPELTIRDQLDFTWLTIARIVDFL